ncbi:MAG TPA: flagellar basal body P-ring protein FlgI [Planctomycetota bacterium]|jgi:flagellar P-ring protein precursor FlgI|nr:flagellar basal body P-ring protein FlgI [Planctomycetota bacterium]
MLAPLLLAALLPQVPAPGPTPVPVPIPLPTPDRRAEPVVYPTPIVPYADGGAGLDVPPSTAHATVTPIAPVEGPPQPEVPEEDVHVRILDLVEIDGVRANQLEGVGIVTGLSGTGDKGNAARQALANYIRRNNVNVANADVDIGNVALVTVTCRLDPWKKFGMPIDVSVQAVNGASSLFGGFLLQTPLKGADNDVYVVAQGSVAVGGFSGGGKAASVTQNHLTSGTLTGGGIVEKEVPMSVLSSDGEMHVHLRSPNYVTATRVAREIARFAAGAHAVDAATIRIALPSERLGDPIAFIAELGEHSIVPGDDAVVVVNERTGTVVVGQHVRIATALITHGNLTISVAESEQISQPNSFSEGQTAAVQRTDVSANVESRGLQVVAGGTTVSQLASSLNRLGVSPRDLVAIFQALQQAGYLHARLEIQ